MTRTLLPLTLPATPRSSREQLRFVLPRPLWPLLKVFLKTPPKGTDPAGPLLLAFHGTSFMDDCFKWLAQQAPLPPQRAWRDWCEPPAAMLTCDGQAAYPASIKRAIAWGVAPETPSNDLDDDGVPTGSPAWLRKLYLPLHDRFTVVVVELICLAAGWPPLDRERVKEAGLLVRRLCPFDPAADEDSVEQTEDVEKWEDWIAIDSCHGRWQCNSSWDSTPGRDPASWPGLVSQPLAVAPGTLEGMGNRCVLTGYLSLTTGEQEASAASSGGDTRTNALTALPVAPTAAKNWLPPEKLLREVLEDTVLPVAPQHLEPARNNLRNAIPTPSPEGVDRATFPTDELLDPVLEQTLVRLLVEALDNTRFRSDVEGSVVSGVALWRQAVSDGLEGLPPGLTLGAVDDWSVLLRDRLETWLEPWITGQPLVVGSEERRDRFRDALLPALVAAALVRARGCRLALAAARDRARGDATTDLPSAEAGAPPPAPGEHPLAHHSLADLGEGLESVLATERERAMEGGLAPWSRCQSPGDAQRLERVDRNLRLLAEHYAPFEAQLALAGPEVRVELRKRAECFETSMGESLNALRQRIGCDPETPGIPSLLERGLDLLEPPATALLLLLPGLGDGLRRYDDSSSHPGAEALVERQLQVPRFDANHIYAVQAWVRVSGRTPAEAERVIWSPRSEPFVLAEPTDLLGSQVVIRTPTPERRP